MHGSGKVKKRFNRKRKPTSYYAVYKTERSPAFPYTSEGLAAAKDWLQEINAEYYNQIYIPSANKMTFGEVIPFFLEYQETRTKFKSREKIQKERVAQHKSQLRKFYSKCVIHPAGKKKNLYDTRLTEIDGAVIRDIASQLRVGLRTEKTAKNYYSTFSMIMAFAAMDGKRFGLKVNPCFSHPLRWDTSSRQLNERDVLPDKKNISTEYVSWLIRNAETLKSKAIFALAATCGPRRGELAALDWENLDLAAKRLHIKATVSKDGKIEWPKTQNGIRADANALPIPESVVKILNEYWLSVGRLKSGFVFPQKKDPQKYEVHSDSWRFELMRLAFRHVGLTLKRTHRKAKYAVYENENLIATYNGEDAKREMFKVHGANPMTFHDFRHFYASKLIHEETDVWNITRLMGHDSIQTTEKIYNSWLPKKEYDGIAENVAKGMELNG